MGTRRTSEVHLQVSLLHRASSFSPKISDDGVCLLGMSACVVRADFSVETFKFPSTYDVLATVS